MSIALEIKTGLRTLGRIDAPTKTRISRAARLAGIAYDRAYRLWYGRISDKSIRAVEYVSVKNALARSYDAARKEAMNVAVEMEKAAARLEAVDAEFYRADADALRAVALQARAKAHLSE